MIEHNKRLALSQATIAAADELFSALGCERPYAMCLQTADDGMSVGLGANTEVGYRAKRASEAEVEEMTPHYAAYLRWTPAEWRYEAVGDEHFARIDQTLVAIALEGSGSFEIHFNQLIDAMIDALADLRSERAAALDGVTLFVTISDSDAAEAIEKRSATRLNPPELAAAFLARLG